MTRMTRREVLKATAAASTLFRSSRSRARGPPAKCGRQREVRVGVAGINGRGRSHVDEFLQMPDVEVAYLIDPDSRLFPGDESAHRGPLVSGAQVRARHPRRAGGQESRCHQRGDLQSLALADHHLGLPGRQARVRRETDQPQRV